MGASTKVFFFFGFHLCAKRIEFINNKAFCSYIEYTVREWTSIGINLYFVFDGLFSQPRLPSAANFT
jgi:hypothetical protein